MAAIEGVAFPVDQVPKDPITEAALHVGEASVAAEAAFTVATTALLPVPMIKVNIKPTSAHTIATIRAPKTSSIKMEVVVMRVQLPPLSTLPRARQTATLRVTAMLKVRLKLRLNIQCEYRQLSYVVASAESQSSGVKLAAPHCILRWIFFWWPSRHKSLRREL